MKGLRILTKVWPCYLSLIIMLSGFVSLGGDVRAKCTVLNMTNRNIDVTGSPTTGYTEDDTLEAYLWLCLYPGPGSEINTYSDTLGRGSALALCGIGRGGITSSVGVQLKLKDGATDLGSFKATARFIGTSSYNFNLNEAGASQSVYATPAPIYSNTSTHGNLQVPNVNAGVVVMPIIRILYINDSDTDLHFTQTGGQCDPYWTYAMLGKNSNLSVPKTIYVDPGVVDLVKGTVTVPHEKLNPNYEGQFIKTALYLDLKSYNETKYYGTVVFENYCKGAEGAKITFVPNVNDELGNVIKNSKTTWSKSKEGVPILTIHIIPKNP